MMIKAITILWRWVLIVVLATEACALLLQGLVPGLLVKLRGGDHIHIFYTARLWCVPYLICVWGLVTRRAWAFKVVALISLFETVAYCVDAVVFGTLLVIPPDTFANILIVAFLALPFLAADARKRVQPA
jgi:hypothetical protein